MSSAAAALTPATPAKSPKKRAKSQKKKKTGPTVSDLILKAVSASTERGGVSLAAVKKTLKAGGYDVVKNKSRVITAIKRLVINTSLVQTKGTGASGSFKLNKKTPTPRKKKVVKKKKPKAKKVKRTSVKKTAGGASPAAKKSPKKKSKAKSPKKAKKTQKPKRSVPRCTRTRAAAKK